MQSKPKNLENNQYKSKNTLETTLSCCRSRHANIKPQLNELYWYVNITCCTGIDFFFIESLLIIFFSPLLVDDGIDGDGGLAGLPIANDELSLSTTNGHQRVHGLDACLHGLLHRLPENTRKRPLRFFILICRSDLIRFCAQHFAHSNPNPAFKKHWNFSAPPPPQKKIPLVNQGWNY